MAEKALGEKRVFEQDDVIGLVTRVTSRPHWHAWVIVEAEDPTLPGLGDDPTYGAPGFEGIQSLIRFYVHDVHYWAKRIRPWWGGAGWNREDKAARAATEAALKFIAWRSEQQAVERELEAA